MQVLYRMQKTTSGGLKIGDINRFLDRLAVAQDRLCFFKPYPLGITNFQ